MLPTLRDYQPPCIAAGVRFFKSNRIRKPKIIVAPTAAGKSLIIAKIASELEGKVLILQPSLELLIQNFNKYIVYDHNVAAFSASAGQKKLAKVTFATIGSIVKVPELFAEFSYLIIDEAHLYPAKDESMFGIFRLKNPQLKILGLTATPFRLDNSSSSGSRLVMMHNSNIYNGYQHIIQISEIREKYWAPIDYIQEEVSGNKLVVNTTGADFTERSLELYGKSVEEQINACINRYIDEPMLIFVPSVKQAEKLAKMYPLSGFICGSTKTSERKKIIQHLKDGYIKRIFNYGVLGVGFDYPELMILVDAIPTLSLAKHYQKVGRITRVHPLGIHIRKKYIDLAGNTNRFGNIEDLEIRLVGTTYHVFSKEKQLTGVLMQSLSGPPPVRTFVGDFEDMEITFGKNKGKVISECEISWLSWAMDNCGWNRELVHNITLFLAAREEVASV